MTVSPKYLLVDGNDVSILKLSRNSTKAPTKVAGAGERALWNAGTVATIAGFGTTTEGGDAPDTLQKAQVPVTSDAYCGSAYSNFDVESMLCAGYPEGGIDTCQGDSGGPLFSGGRVIGRHQLRRGLRPPGQARRVRPRGRRAAARVDPHPGPRTGSTRASRRRPRRAAAGSSRSGHQEREARVLLGLVHRGTPTACPSLLAGRRL